MRALMGSKGEIIKLMCFVSLLNISLRLEFLPLKIHAIYLGILVNCDGSWVMMMMMMS